VQPGSLINSGGGGGGGWCAAAAAPARPHALQLHPAHSISLLLLTAEIICPLRSASYPMPSIDFNLMNALEWNEASITLIISYALY